MSYVYVVQDHEREIRGITSSLPLARDIFETVRSELLTLEEFQEFQTLCEQGDISDWGPWVLVFDVDVGCVWSYEALSEIDQAIERGEQYDD